MNLFSISISALSAAAGFRSAWLWYRSSQIEIVPLYAKLGQIEPIGGSSTHWTIGILEAVQKGAAVNRAAAIWTAAATGLGALATAVGAFIPSA